MICNAWGLMERALSLSRVMNNLLADGSSSHERKEYSRILGVANT